MMNVVDNQAQGSACGPTKGKVSKNDEFCIKNEESFM